MFEYGNYEDVLQVNEPHQPVLLVLDVSMSMEGRAIRSLNNAVKQFVEEICTDLRSAERVDVCVIAFNDTTQIVQNWCPIKELKPLNLTAFGGTNLSLALETGVQMLKERGHLYENMGIEVKMPYLILVTDAYGGDVTEIAKTIKQRTEDHKLKLWVLAVKGYDKATVAKLTDGKRVFELVDEDGYDFREFFNFMSVSIKAVSTSAPGQEYVHVQHNIGREGSSCRVPDLDDWLNN